MLVAKQSLSAGDKNFGSYTSCFNGGDVTDDVDSR